MQILQELGRLGNRFHWNRNVGVSDLIGEVRSELHTRYSSCADPAKKRALSQLYDAISTSRSGFSGKRGGRAGSSSRGGFSGSNFSGSGSYRNAGHEDYSRYFGGRKLHRARVYFPSSIRSYLIIFSVSLGSRSSEENSRDRSRNSTSSVRNECPYAVLGLSVGASKVEVKKAFKKKAMEFHPG